MTWLRYAVAGGLFVAATLAADAAQAQVRDQKLRFTFQTSRESYMGVGANAFADAVRQKSGGKMNVELFPDGSLGGDIQNIAAVRGGTVDAMGLSAGLLVGLVKEFGLFDLPFLFQNDEEAAAVMNGPFGKRISEMLTEKDLVALAFWGVDFRNLSNNRRPVTKLEEVKGLKIRVLQSPIYVDLWNTLGANAVAMPFPEVYSALEQGTVDGQENPYSAIESAKLYEVQKYLSLTRHIYFVAASVFSKKTWDRLNADERKIIQEAAAQAQGQWKAAALKEREVLALKFKDKMRINEVAPEEIAKFRAAVKPVVDKYTANADPAAVKDLFDSIEKVRRK
jgi:tripartite ATP-independent transporter DctP family solute receptor